MAKKLEIQTRVVTDPRAYRHHADAVCAAERHIATYGGNGVSPRLRRRLTPGLHQHSAGDAAAKEARIFNPVHRQCGVSYHTKGIFRSREMELKGVEKKRLSLRQAIGSKSFKPLVWWALRRPALVAVFKENDHGPNNELPKRKASGGEAEKWNKEHGLRTREGPNLGLKWAGGLTRFSSRALRLAGSLVTNPHAEQSPASPRQGERPRRVIKER